MTMPEKDSGDMKSGVVRSNDRSYTSELIRKLREGRGGFVDMDAYLRERSKIDEEVLFPTATAQYTSDYDLFEPFRTTPKQKPLKQGVTATLEPENSLEPFTFEEGESTLGFSPTTRKLILLFAQGLKDNEAAGEITNTKYVDARKELNKRSHILIETNRPDQIQETDIPAYPISLSIMQGDIMVTINHMPEVPSEYAELFFLMGEGYKTSALTELMESADTQEKIKADITKLQNLIGAKTRNQLVAIAAAVRNRNSQAT